MAGFVKAAMPCLIELECAFTGDAAAEWLQGALNARMTDMIGDLVSDATNTLVDAIVFPAANMAIGIYS